MILDSSIYFSIVFLVHIVSGGIGVQIKGNNADATSNNEIPQKCEWSERIKRDTDAGSSKYPSKPDPDSPALLYLPLGGSGKPQCLPAAGAKLAQLVPMMFAGMTFTIFDAVATIANNINSNNNNLNNQNINFQMSTNTVVTGNINVANQINVVNMAGRKKRAAEFAKMAVDYMAKYNVIMETIPEAVIRGHAPF